MVAEALVVGGVSPPSHPAHPDHCALSTTTLTRVPATLSHQQPTWGSSPPPLSQPPRTPTDHATHRPRHPPTTPPTDHATIRYYTGSGTGASGKTLRLWIGSPFGFWGGPFNQTALDAMLAVRQLRRWFGPFHTHFLTRFSAQSRIFSCPARAV